MMSGSATRERIPLGTKAETLERLIPVMRSARICPVHIVPVARLRGEGTRAIEAVARRFAPGTVIVRSSATAEDSVSASCAGVFTSVPSVPAADRAALRAAIESVVRSYEAAGLALDEQQVLVQPMLERCELAGVVLTRTLTDDAPYYTVNWSSTSDTAAVTGGSRDELELVHVWREAGEEELAEPLRGIVRMCRELEEHIGSEALDIEFARQDGQLYLLQVRPIVMTAEAGDDAHVRSEVHHAISEFVRRDRPRPALHGARTVLSDMADWNPAEMIGARPRPLAYSLYRDQITEGMWRQARARIGYFDPAPHELMIEVGGRPFIDVRVDLNSFLPAGIGEDLGGRLIDHCIDRLRRRPFLHDKVEFEVCPTCLAPDFDDEAERLRGAGFSRHDIDELRTLLRDLTNGILGDRAGVFTAMHARHEALRLLLDEPPPNLSLPERLERSRYWGAEPFAVVVRAAFIGAAQVRALVGRGILERAQADAFARSVETVSTRFTRAVTAAAQGRMSRDELLADYGHLRPGTYEITVPSYRASPDLYLGTGAGNAAPIREPEPFELDRATRESISRALASCGLDLTAEELFAFLRQSMTRREEYKFQYSRALCDVLDAISADGREIGLTDDQLSFIPIRTLIALREQRATRSEYLAVSRAGRRRWSANRQVVTPDVVTGAEAFSVVRTQQRRPNFVTSHRVVAEACRAASGAADAELRGRIALIESADPGYDWVFTRGIVGLVTKFGGAASHMTVRCAELDVPAAIGCGELLYDALSGAALVELDCTNSIVRSAVTTSR